jgi:transposase
MSDAKPSKWAGIIRDAFKRTGWSINEIAKRAGVTYSSSHRFFAKGFDNADVRTVEKWCNAIGLELRPVQQQDKKRKD